MSLSLEAVPSRPRMKQRGQRTDTEPRIFRLHAVSKLCLKPTRSSENSPTTVEQPVSCRQANAVAAASRVRTIAAGTACVRQRSESNQVRAIYNDSGRQAVQQLDVICAGHDSASSWGTGERQTKAEASPEEEAVDSRPGAHRSASSAT